MTQELQDKWEREALKVFLDVYTKQFNRTKRLIERLDIEELEKALADLYRGEPDKVRLQVHRFFDEMADSVAIDTLGEIDREIDDTDILTNAIRTMTEKAALEFAKTTSKTGLELSYSIIESWRKEDGATQADLFARFDRVWKGQRPKAAAVTETTRLVTETRLETFKAVGGERYFVNTREDELVRDDHSAIARESRSVNGFPIDDTDHLPPFGVNCRCGVVLAS